MQIGYFYYRNHSQKYKIFTTGIQEQISKWKKERFQERSSAFISHAGKEISERFSFDTVYTQQSRRQTNSCQTWSAKIITKPHTIQVYNDFMRNTDTSDVMLIMTDHVDGVRYLRTAATNGPIEHGEPW
jgi:hypothetical protein